MGYKVSKELAESTKKCVDVIYELTKDGYTGSFSSLGSATLMKVLSECIKRGVVTKTRNKRQFTYLWVAQSEPTTQFYVSVAGVIGSHQKELDKVKRAAQKATRMPQNEPVAKEEEKRVPQVIQPAQKSLKDYSIEELWGELKSRGVEVENNHLVIIERRVIA